MKSTVMDQEQANIAALQPLLTDMGEHLDSFLTFEHTDALCKIKDWKAALDKDMPLLGIGAQQTLEEMNQHVIPNGSAIPNPGCTSFITTGATNIGVLANLAATVASPQRIGLTAFNYLEEKSLSWMAELFSLPSHMQGVYSSGGSVANILGLGAARQVAFERIGVDPAEDGIHRPCRIYATKLSHHTIHRACAVLGLGRKSVVTIVSDHMGRMLPHALAAQIQQDIKLGLLPVAVVVNAGATSTGAIDPIDLIANISQQFDLWLHVDGAYGLPGILDPEIRPLYKGIEKADSVTVDPHKWLGAPVGIGATFVRDRNILQRAFNQGPSDYLEGSVNCDEHHHSMDSLGIPYSDFGVELSAPARGAVVWALLREIGKQGLQARICRHNAMAKYIAQRAKQHPNLELLLMPTLSICCFRYITNEHTDLNQLNNAIHRQLVRNGQNIPSTAMVDGKLAIRPCFVGARTDWQHAQALVDEVLEIGKNLKPQPHYSTSAKA